MTRTSAGVSTKPHRISRARARIIAACMTILSACHNTPTDGPNAARVEFTQQPNTVLAGQSVTFAAHVVKAGVEVPATISYKLTDRDLSFATIDAATGVVTGATVQDFAVVAVTVTATADDASIPGADAALDVHSRVQQITLSTPLVSLSAGGQYQFTQTTAFAAGSPTEPAPIVTWHSNTTAVTVDANGRITAVAVTPAGAPAMITAKAEGITSNQAAVTVAAFVSVPTTLVMSSSTSGPVVVGATRQYTLDVRDQNGASMLILIAPAWSIVGASGIATINATSGLASCVGAGTVTVHAIGPAGASGAKLTADQSLQCVVPLGNPAVAAVFSPPVVTVSVAGLASTTASYRDANGQPTNNGCPLVFSLDAPGIATLTANGLTATVSGITGGSSALRASCATGVFMGIGKVQSVVPPSNVATVVMTTATSYVPASALATTRQFSAIAQNGNGVTVDGVTMSFSLIGDAAASISQTSGVVTIGPSTGPGFRGGAVITATSGGQADIGVISYGDAGTIRGQLNSVLGQYLGASTATATNVATGVVTAGAVSNTGLFYIAGLAPGAYNVRVSATGTAQSQTFVNVGVSAGGVTLVNPIPFALRGGF